VLTLDRGRLVRDEQLAGDAPEPRRPREEDAASVAAAPASPPPEVALEEEAR
jgi:hypothetical protein